MHTCTHAYMHTCIHAYMHVCMHAYIRLCMLVAGLAAMRGRGACIHAKSHAEIWGEEIRLEEQEKMWLVWIAILYTIY